MAAVVADTSPLIALYQLGQVSLLQRIFGEIYVPPAVARELSPGMPELPSWIVVRPLVQPIAAEILRASLGAGESEALSLVLEVKAELVIVDDRPARRHALNLGIPVAGTAGILVRAKRLGLISEVRPLLDETVGHGFRVSPAIREKVLADDPWVVAAANDGSPYGTKAFTGREWDPEIGLYYYRARYYDPKVGRFISEDPIGLGGGCQPVCLRPGQPRLVPRSVGPLH